MLHPTLCFHHLLFVILALLHAHHPFNAYIPTDTPLLRLLPPAYSDGVYMPADRPANPLTLSEQLMAGESGTQSSGGRTAFQVFFGKKKAEEWRETDRH